MSKLYKCGKKRVSNKIKNNLIKQELFTKRGLVEVCIISQL